MKHILSRYRRAVGKHGILGLARHGLQHIRNLRGGRDYQSPSLSPLPVDFESFFPFVVRRRPFNPWVRHTGRYDRRFPGTGLTTYDETALLYNYGLALKHGILVEIGCWVGWSTAAWALSGTHVVTIDPVLSGLPQGESCRASLRETDTIERVEFIGDYSHPALARLAASGLRASGIFIDGDHVADAPLQDAIDAQSIAADDCLIIFHDLVLPNIATALTWLGNNGWQCGIHYTAQFIGVAWRGNSRPIYCQPDSQVDWNTVIRARYPHLARFRPIE